MSISERILAHHPWSPRLAVLETIDSRPPHTISSSPSSVTTFSASVPCAFWPPQHPVKTNDYADAKAAGQEMQTSKHTTAYICLLLGDKLGSVFLSFTLAELAK